VTRIEEETRDDGVIEWLDSALTRALVVASTPQDARTGGVRFPLAVGLGAEPAIFSLVTPLS
jgi:hypothetical protein